MGNSFGRRSLVRGAGGGVALLAAGRSPLFAAAPPIVVTAFGGVFEKAIREVIVADFENKTGTKAQVMGGQPEQWMAQVEANRAHPPIDVMLNNVDGAILAGKLHNGSWEAAVDKLSRGDYWHSEIALMSDELGYLRLLTALKAAQPKSKTSRPKFGSIIRYLKGWLSRAHALHADRSRS